MKGLGGIVNDPYATILTRKALGRLSTGGLIVNKKGLTIDELGRFTVPTNNGLSQDGNGLAVAMKPNGGLEDSGSGLAVKTKPDSGFGSFEFSTGSLFGDGVLYYNKKMQAFYTRTATVTVNFVNPSEDYNIFVLGAALGDVVIVSPTSLPPVAISAWSAFVSGTWTVTLRVQTGYIGAGSIPFQFRFIVLRVSS